TVASGVSPDPAPCRARGVSPPIGNWDHDPAPCPEGLYLTIYIISNFPYFSSSFFLPNLLFVL
ncbi:MAG: hypothetical protein ABSE06_17965, partial [Anaerolineaceae bacterium]